MSDDDNKDDPKRNQPPAPVRTPYAVGYGKPPVEHRFQKGKSGNEKGRPNGAKTKRRLDDSSILQLFLEEAARKIVVHENGRRVRMSASKAAMRTLVVKAIQGVQWAQNLYIKLATQTEEAEGRSRIEIFEAAVGYVAYWNARILQSLQSGVKGEEPPIHPADIRLDPKSGEVWICELDDDDKTTRDQMSDSIRAMAMRERQLRNEALRDQDQRKAKRLLKSADEFKTHHASILAKFLASPYMNPFS